MTDSEGKRGIIGNDALARAAWRKSSFSGGGGTGGGNCVELAPLDDGTIAVRNSKTPTAGVLFLTPDKMHTWITNCKAGKFDQVTNGGKQGNH